MTIKLESKEGWKWYGFPGHHCCGSRCQYHLATNIGGKVLVTTVGRFVPDPLRAPEKTLPVGSGRDFQTMVFKIDGEDENGDPNVVSGVTLDSAGYNSSLEAEQGHYAMCDRWAEMSARREAVPVQDQAGMNIKMIVLCINAGGAPEFHVCVLNVTDDQLAHGEHYDLAIESAEWAGYARPMIAFDQDDPAARQLGELLAWL